MKYIIIKFCLLILGITIPAQAELYDMGEIGSYESVNIRSIQSFNARIQNKINSIKVSPRKIIFPEQNIGPTPRILPKANKRSVRSINFDNPISLKAGTVILLFNPKDIYYADSLKGINIDIAYCVNCNNSDEIEAFWKRVGRYPPTYTAGEELLNTLTITSYPALVTIKGKYAEIVEGY